MKLVDGMNVTSAGLEGLVMNSRHLTTLDLSYCSRNRNDHKLTPEVTFSLNSDGKGGGPSCGEN